MQEVFVIYTDRLRKEGVHLIEGPVDPEFFELNDRELRAEKPVEVEGKAYLSEQDLVIFLKGKAKILLPCSICNEMTEIILEAKDFYHVEPLSNISSGVYNFREVLREAFLIELPQFAECGGGKCPARETITPYIKKETPVKEDIHFPFSDL